MVVVRFSVLLDKVRQGEKRQTIRPYQNYQHLEEGDKIHCYSTKKVSCSRRPIVDELLYEGVVTDILEVRWSQIKNSYSTARLDGFQSAEEMREWFQGKYGEDIDDKMFRIIIWR